jgi:hypothetical protein
LALPHVPELPTLALASGNGSETLDNRRPARPARHRRPDRRPRRRATRRDPAHLCLARPLAPGHLNRDTVAVLDHQRPTVQRQRQRQRRLGPVAALVVLRRPRHRPRPPTRRDRHQRAQPPTGRRDSSSRGLHRSAAAGSDRGHHPVPRTRRPRAPRRPHRSRQQPAHRGPAAAARRRDAGTHHRDVRAAGHQAARNRTMCPCLRSTPVGASRRRDRNRRGHHQHTARCGAVVCGAPNLSAYEPSAGD